MLSPDIRFGGSHFQRRPRHQRRSRPPQAKITKSQHYVKNRRHKPELSQQVATDIMLNISHPAKQDLDQTSAAEEIG